MEQLIVIKITIYFYELLVFPNLHAARQVPLPKSFIISRAIVRYLLGCVVVSESGEKVAGNAEPAERRGWIRTIASSSLDYVPYSAQWKHLGNIWWPTRETA